MGLVSIMPDYENKYIIKYGSYGDGDQGFVGPFDSEEDCEEWWENNPMGFRNSGWEMAIQELYNPDDPESEMQKINKD